MLFIHEVWKDAGQQNEMCNNIVLLRHWSGCGKGITVQMCHSA